MAQPDAVIEWLPRSKTP